MLTAQKFRLIEIYGFLFFLELSLPSFHSNFSTRVQLKRASKIWKSNFQ